MMGDAPRATAQLRASLAALKCDVATSFRLCGRDFGVLGAELISALERGRRASSDALAHERAARGQLETRLAELQGNIRVLCRVRPLTAAAAGSSGEESDATSPDRRRKRVQVESARELSVYSPVDGALFKSFSFTRVFHGQHSQTTVFKEVAPLVRAAVAGHHACVFAYGQTGSGKTHTMQGTESDRGLYYRAADTIYHTVDQQQHVYDFHVSVQIVEVYNEEIYDLLGDNSTGGTTTTTGDKGSPSGMGCHVGATSLCGNASASPASTVEIRHGEDGVYLKNVGSVAASSVKELYEAIGRSRTSRSKNDRSNRSHTVLMIDIRRTSKANGETDTGRLALVDLAGSERLSKTAETPALTMGKSQRTERTEITRLNGVVANQVSQLQTLQEKLTAELELRKKYEKRLEEYRQEEHRRRSKGDEARKILQQLGTPSPPQHPPPISSRRSSLNSRKEKLASNAQGLNGIENVSENILRGNESSPETAEVLTTNSDKPSGISPPTNFSRRLSLSALDQTAGGVPRRSTRPGKRKRTLASEKVRSILKKQRGEDGGFIDLTEADDDNSVAASKQVSFKLSLATNSSSALPSRELTATASTTRVAVGGAVRVLAATRSAAGPSSTGKVAPNTGKRVKPKWNGWR
ncbi:Kinesin-like protein KIN-14Q [Phytophthora ramorum]|uniref:Kinesin-like protein KIN-14Q n=1 Tax=Phytophthora ramorum TaxID=164328 RepID=UPI003096BF7B|nr:Kinesin-like protein KIN-14Q [Phytophthora ramorum]